MTTGVVPRRSVLYMPASNARALDKARTIPADAIIFDLEDAVAPEAKELARAQACAAVSSGAYGRRELTIRCNGLDTPWGGEDLAAVAAAGPAAVVVPKVSGPAHLDEVAALVGSVRIWAMVETPAAIWSVRAIAAHPAVDVLVLGTNDLAKELHAVLVPGRAPLLPHLATALLAAREAGKVILDGVYNDVKDLAGLEAECLQGAQFGFDGKTLVHPAQVEVANRIWAPTGPEVEHAARLIEAFEQARQAGHGVVTVDGKMIENLHVENAHRTLATAQAIAALG